MKARQAREIRTLVDCQTFLEKHPEVAADVNASASKLNLDAAVRDSAAFAEQQVYATRQRAAQTEVTKAARRKLRRSMQPVAEVAKTNYRDVPELIALFMPPVAIGVAALVAAAGGMANSAEPLADVFVASGLRPTFADDIRARAAALTEAAARGQDATVLRAGATAGIGASIKRGRRAVALIDSLLVPNLDDASDLLAAWKSAKRIAAKPGPAPGSVVHFSLAPRPTPAALPPSTSETSEARPETPSNGSGG